MYSVLGAKVLDAGLSQSTYTGPVCAELEKAFPELHSIVQALTKQLEQAPATPWWLLVVIIDSRPCSYQNLPQPFESL